MPALHDALDLLEIRDRFLLGGSRTWASRPTISSAVHP